MSFSYRPYFSSLDIYEKSDVYLFGSHPLIIITKKETIQKVNRHLDLILLSHEAQIHQTVQLQQKEEDDPIVSCILRHIRQSTDPEIPFARFLADL